MNAPLPPDAVAVASLPVADIVPSPSNPRKHFDETYITELAESIKAHGLIQPITVRPCPAGRKRPLPPTTPWPFTDTRPDPLYEIVVGECRWRAAKLAGLTEIPGFWRELDDKQVLEIQVIENLQRRDVHPIEEAEGYEALMKRHGYTADEIAAKIGKSKGYVYARLKLIALCPEAREAFFTGKLEASTALLVARIPGATLQKKALQSILNGYGGEPLSYRAAKDHIRSGFTISLQQATFKLDDATLLPNAGSCQDCPKRSGNSPELCADLDSEDVCTDTECFNAKKLARRDQLVAIAEQKGIKVYTGDEAREIMPWGTHELNPDQYASLDAKVQGDAHDRTYRDILGDEAPVSTLIENRAGQMIELGEPKALERALRKAGWQPDLIKATETAEEAARDEAQQQEREARNAAAESEATWRKCLRDELTRKLLAETDDGSINTDPVIVQLAIAWVRDFAATIGELPDQLLADWNIETKQPYETEAELPGICEEMSKWSAGKAIAFLFTAFTHDEERVIAHCFDAEKDQPHIMLAVAEAIDFDLETLPRPVFVGLETAPDPTPAAQAHEEVATEPAAPAKPKGKKAAAKNTETKADPAPTSSANAPAAPAKPLKPELADGLIYCNPDNPEQTWSGKGKEPAWVKELYAQGKGLDVRDKTTPAPTSSANEPAAPVETTGHVPAWPFPTANEYPEPNESGVYPKEEAELIEWASKNKRLQIYILQLQQGWIYAVDVEWKDGGVHGPLSMRHMKEPHESRGKAITQAAEEAKALCLRPDADRGYSAAEKEKLAAWLEEIVAAGQEEETAVAA